MNSNINYTFYVTIPFHHWNNEYIEKNFKENLYHSNQNLLVRDYNNINKKIFATNIENLLNKFPNFNYKFFSNYEISIYNENLLLNFRNHHSYITLDLFSKNKKIVDDILNIIYDVYDDYDSIEQVRARWSFIDTKGNFQELIDIIEKNDMFIPEFYPFVDDINKFCSDFKNSKENILILIGEPGLGKISFIRHILHKNKWDATIAYDPDVMAKDEFYINFLKSTDSVLVLEDADLLLQNRLDTGNKIMSRLLNASDGLVKIKKKFIFTANINNIKDIDDALIRKGRCFRILHFKEFSYNEAVNIANKLGKQLPKKSDSYNLADILSSEYELDNVIPLIKTGFR